MVQSTSVQDEAQCDHLMWVHRRDSSMPFQTWQAFKPEDYVEIANAYGDIRRGYARDFWWGYESDLGGPAEGVIIKARKIMRCRVKALSSGDSTA